MNATAIILLTFSTLWTVLALWAARTLRRYWRRSTLLSTVVAQVDSWLEKPRAKKASVPPCSVCHMPAVGMDYVSVHNEHEGYTQAVHVACLTPEYRDAIKIEVKL